MQLTGPSVAVPGQEIQLLGDSYIVEAVDLINNTLTLVSEYRGSNATAVAIDDAFTTPAVNYGIKLEGVRNPFDVAMARNYFRNRFLVTFSDSSSPAKNISNSFEGLGEWEEVAMNEYLSWGFVGQRHMIAVPPVQREAIVAELATYGTLQIRWEGYSDSLMSISKAKSSVLIYFELAPTAPDTVTPGNATEVLLNTFIANPDLAAAGLVPTSLNE